MPKIRITELPPTYSMAYTDIFPMVNVAGDGTYKITLQDLATNMTGLSAAAEATTATSATTAGTANTASFVTASNVYGPFGSNSVISASHALNGGVTSIIAGSGISISSATGNVTITNTGGGGGSPGGSNQQLQYNNGGAFGGVSSAVFNGTTLSVTGSFSGSLTGSVFGTSSYSISSSYVLSASYAVSSSFAATAASSVTATSATSANTATTASYAFTASYVNTLVQNVAITGSVVISGSNGAGIFSQGATLVDYVSGISNTGSYMVWRAPFSCSVVAVYGYYIGGTAPRVNAARSGSSGYGMITGSSFLVDQENVWVPATASALQNVNFNSGDSLQVIMSGSTNNQLAVQVDFIRKF